MTDDLFKKNQAFQEKFMNNLSLAEIQKEIETGIDINFDGGVLNLLFQIRLNQKYEKLCLLHKNGADLNAWDRYGRTPLMYCKDPKSIKYLIENGADLYAEFVSGKQAFMYVVENIYATHKDTIDTLDLMFFKGVDLTALTYDKQGLFHSLCNRKKRLPFEIQNAFLYFFYKNKMLSKRYKKKFGKNAKIKFYLKRGKFTSICEAYKNIRKDK